MQVSGAKVCLVVGMHLPSQPAARSKGCGEGKEYWWYREGVFLLNANDAGLVVHDADTVGLSELDRT